MKPEVLSSEYIRRGSRQYLVLSTIALCLAAVAAFLPLVFLRTSGFAPDLLAAVMGLLIMGIMLSGRRERLQEMAALLKRIDDAGIKNSARSGAEQPPAN